MLERKRIVLTGGPASGKTTLLNCIDLHNTCCFEEVSREVIIAAQAKGVKRPFLDNPLRFSEALFEHRLHDFFIDSPMPIQIYDRGIHDVVAYLNAIGHEVPCGMLEDCKTNSYDTVFIFPPWKEIYTQDAERVESFEEAQRLHQALLETYVYFGMQCIEVPKDGVKNRLTFITNHL